MLLSSQNIAPSNLPSITSFHSSSSSNTPSVYGSQHSMPLSGSDASHTGDALGKALASVCVLVVSVFLYHQLFHFINENNVTVEFSLRKYHFVILVLSCSPHTVHHPCN